MRIRLLALAAATLTACAHTAPPPTPPPTAHATQTRAFILGGRRAGIETVAVDGTTRTVDFEFNDRGRGPKTHTVLTSGGDAITTSLRTSGNDYFKVPVDETYANGAWSNGAKKGSALAGAPAFFVSMYGPPEETAVLARALLAAPEHRFTLLPAGEASIRKVGDLMISAAGRSQHVTCYEISGLGFTPSPVWLDDHNELFASASSWSSVIADGWDSVVPQLLKAQDAWRDEAVSHEAARLMRAPAGGGIVITNARLFDPVTLQTTPGTTIVIRGNRIEAAGTGIAIPNGLEHIDAAGRTVIPGLWDMHTHNSADDGLLNISNGITSVRDLANDTDFLLDLRKKIDSGAAIGPRIVLAGIIDAPGKYAGPTKVLVDTEAQAREAVENYAKLGYEQIKIYSSVRPELVPFIARLAHERGMRVSGHVPAFMRAEDAVRAGYDEIQHVNFLFLNFWPDIQDTRTPVRFTAVAERAATLDLNSAEVKAFIELLREHHTVIDPTVSVFEGMFVSRKGTMSPSYAVVADRLPPQVRRGFLTGGLPVPDGMDQRYHDSFRNLLAMVKALYDAHVPIVAGTDAMAGYSLARELELYVEAGIPPAEVLRIATLGAAHVMRHDDQLGSIAPGKLADLDIIDGDPATNISDVREVVTVIKDGKVFDPKGAVRHLRPLRLHYANFRLTFALLPPTLSLYEAEMTYLTERQRDILQFIRDCQRERGVAPTHREICDHFGFSSYGTVYKHLSLLQKKGLIRRDWNQKRGVELVENDDKPASATASGVLELPLFGYIAAGRPLDVEVSNETITVPERLTSRGENYVLKVKGDSMIDDGIMDGDYVIIARRERAENGEMVVANVSGEVTLKRFYHEGEKVRLQPANSMMHPIYASARDVAVQGVVVGLMRRF